MTGNSYYYLQKVGSNSYVTYKIFTIFFGNKFEQYFQNGHIQITDM